MIEKGFKPQFTFVCEHSENCGNYLPTCRFLPCSQICCENHTPKKPKLFKDSCGNIISRGDYVRVHAENNHWSMIVKVAEIAPNDRQFFDTGTYATNGIIRDRKAGSVCWDIDNPNHIFTRLNNVYREFKF